MASVRPLPPALAEAARQQLNEEPGRLGEDLRKLREWLAKQPHLRARTDDQFLAAFLRGSKFSLERAKEKLDAFYTLRSTIPEFFANRDPTTPEMRRILKQGLFLPLGEDIEGRCVILVRAACYDPSEIRTVDILKLTMMMLEMMMMEDDALVVNGQVGVLDVAGISVSHLTQLSPSLIKRTMVVFQDGYPLRPQGLRYFNMSSIFETIFNLLKSFMKEKLRKRVSIHSNLESLYQTVPKEILPQEYGGEAGPVQDIADRWAAKMEAWRNYFLADSEYGVDESKRPGKNKKDVDTYGFEGSFRKLELD